jgi:hypothetical protein
MKKLIIICGCLFTLSCTNPEDNANMHTDSTNVKYNEENVINSNPGPTDNDAATDKDTSNFPTDSMGTNRPINGKDSGRKQ